MSLEILASSEDLINFYAEKFYFSYSGINKLLYSPRVFYNHYILKQREDSTDAHMIAGRLAHCLLLEPDNYDKQFIMVPGKIPTDSNKIIIDHIFNNNYLPMKNDSLTLEDFSDDILNQLLTNNLYQNLTDDKKDLTLTGDKKRLEKMLTENNKEYFNFLKLKETKTVIDAAIKKQADDTVEVLRAHPQVKSLLGLDRNSSDKLQIFNEIMLSSDWDVCNFGFKGILDNLVVDEESKTLFINDLKLTNRPIQDFISSVEKFRYDIQCTIYRGLAYDRFIAPREDAKEWNMVFTFIVADKFNQVYPYQVSDETANMWQNEFYGVVNKLNYHYEKRDYTLPYELALGNVKL